MTISEVLVPNEARVPPLLRDGQKELTAHRSPLPALTGIRFLAAMLVVFYHSKMPEVLWRHGLWSAGYLIANGRLAVPLFFTLSGFILSYTYQGQIGQRRGPQRFWEARVARVWPLYLFSLLCSSLANHTTPPFLRGLATILMLQAWDPFDKGVAASWNFVCWTLSTEAFFYVLFPLLQRVLERRSFALQAAVLLASLTLSVHYGTANLSYVDGDTLGTIPLAAIHLPEFLAGVCAGNLFLRRSAAVRERGTGPILHSQGLLTWAALLASIFLLCHPNRAYTSWASVSFVALLLGLAGEASMLQRLLSTRALLIGGQISYGIYLLQWPCKAEVNRLCDHLHLWSANLRFGVDCAMLILISAGCFYGIEEPARRVIRSLFAQALTYSAMRKQGRRPAHLL